ncbi:MAG: hypothetical protein ACQ9MH_06560 [Nitrospinales bacterium]
MDKSYAKEISTDFEYELLRNEYFEKMSALGYSIKVYQSKYMDYCQEKYMLASCYTYPIFSTKFLKDPSITLDSKVWVLVNSFLVRSDFFKILKNGYWHSTNFVSQKFGLELPFPWNWDGLRASTVSVSTTMEILRGDIIRSSQGTLFFAHLLIPHDPYIYDSKCQILRNPISEWSLRVDPEFNNKRNSILSHSKKYKMYFQQVGCLNKQLQGFFDNLRSEKIYDKAKIIIHGDHGARIQMRRPTYENRKDLTSQELLDSYSTLFAVKTVGEKFGYDLRVLSLNQIFSSVAGEIFDEGTNIRSQSPYVNLRVRDAREKKKRSFFRWAYPAPKNH